jgi:hypothetical protein
MKTLLVLAMLACAVPALCQDTPKAPPRCELITSEPYHLSRGGTYTSYSESMPCSVCREEVKAAREQGDNRSRRCQRNDRILEHEGFHFTPLN